MGSGGMLGSDLVLQLGSSHFVIGVNSSECDIALPEDCRHAVAEYSPDVVINAAAYTDVDGCETNRNRCFAVNACGVKNIVSACREKGVPVVHFSTDYVFDGSKRTPYREEDDPSPINMYGSSKLEGERFLRESSAGWLLIRTSWLYGFHGKNFVKTIMEKSSAVNKLEVVNDQFGSPTYAADLAAAVKILIEAGKTGIYHFTTRGQCSWYELACKILRLAGRNDVHINAIRSEDLQRTALRPAWSVLGTAKYFQETGKDIRYWDIALNDYMMVMGYAGKGSNVLRHAES